MTMGLLSGCAGCALRLVFVSTALGLGQPGALPRVWLLEDSALPPVNGLASIYKALVGPFPVHPPVGGTRR